MSKRSFKGFLVVNCLASFAIGALFYIPGFKFESVLYRLMRNYLPDMLWSYSLAFALFFIFCDAGKNKTSIACGITSALWGLLMEVFQLLRIAPGTFDIFDFLMEAVSGLIASMVIILCLRRIRNEKVENYCCNSLP